MPRYFSVVWKSNKVFNFLLFFIFFVIIYYLSSHSKEKISVRTHDFRFYPQSHSAIEYNRIQTDEIARSMFLLNESQTYSKVLNYSEAIFRSASFPILWLDAQNDVHWNRVAQRELFNYLLEKQFPNENISTCLSRQLIILEQWRMGGFFSRYHSFIDHFGQTLYSPSVVLLSFTRFTVSHSIHEDFRNEGLLRYFQTISLCSSYIKHPKLKVLYDYLQSIEQKLVNIKMITNVHQLLERDESTVKYKYSREIWKFGYDHVPHRRWLFDRNRDEMKKILNYHSAIRLLINHSNEHIYYNHEISSGWRPRNTPHQDPSDVLNGSITYSPSLSTFSLFRHDNRFN